MHAVMVLNGKPVDITWRPEREGRRRGSRLLHRAEWNLRTEVYSLRRCSVMEMCRRLDGYWGPFLH